MLRTLRQERGWGVRELAERAHVPPGYISELENGKKANPGLDVLRRLARALGVPVTELLG
jgi:transcriptional regulator with XRE-family HTH domain